MDRNVIEAKLRIQADVTAGLQGLKQLRAQVQDAGGAVDRMARQFDRAKSLVTAFLSATAGGIGLAALSRMADGYSSLNARLRIATEGLQEFSAAQAQSTALAQQYQQPLAETAALYTRVLRAVRPLGGGVREAAVATESLLAALRINGAQAAESASAILQFSQALGSGALRGEEFNAIAEAAPPLLDALARGLGRPRDELKSLAEQGQLTSSAIVQALARELPQLRRQAAAIPTTIGGAALQAREALFKLVGQTAESSQAVRTIVGLLKLLAENLETVIALIGGLAVLMASVKLAVFAQGLATTATAAAAGATGMTAFGLAVRGVLGALTGPVGLVVMIGSLAAAWLGLSAAKAKAQERTLDTVQAERDAVAAEVARLDAEIQRQMKDSKLGVAPQVLNEARLNRARLARLDVEIAAMLRQAREEARRADLAGYDDDASGTMRSPRTIREFEAENRSRLAIAKEFADRRAAYILAKDQEIAQARLTGQRELEARLLQEKADALAQQREREEEALRAFSKNETVTRLAAASDLYDKSFDLLLDSLSRQRRRNEEEFAQGMRDAAAYLAERARGETETAAAEIGDLERRLVSLRATLEANKALPLDGLDANARADRREALLRQTEDIAKLEADIVKRKRDAADSELARLDLARQFTRELVRQRELLDGQLAEARGLNLTPEQIRQRVTAQFQAQLDSAARLGDSQEPILKLIDIETTRQQLLQVERDFARMLDRLSRREQEVRDMASSGALTSAEAEEKVIDLRREHLPVLEGLVSRMKELATTPDEKARVENAERTLRLLMDMEKELASSMRTGAVSYLRTALNDIVSGAKSAKEALTDMVRSFLMTMVDALNKQLAEKLVQQFIQAANSYDSSASAGKSPSSGSKDSSGAWWGTFLRVLASIFHTGGIVGSGQVTGRAVNPAVFAFAPRYHSGGVAGLRPNEVPSILQAGEEVLTADDPRHAKNFRGGGIYLTSHFEFNGLYSESEKAAAAQALQMTVDAAIRRWATTESRQGGMLNGLRRS